MLPEEQMVLGLEDVEQNRYALLAAFAPTPSN
jgi:hypothetical protein